MVYTQEATLTVVVTVTTLGLELLLGAGALVMAGGLTSEEVVAGAAVSPGVPGVTVVVSVSQGQGTVDSELEAPGAGTSGTLDEVGTAEVVGTG